MSTSRPWKLTRRLAMVRGEKRIEKARASFRLGREVGFDLTRSEALVCIAGRLRSALRIADVEPENALTLVAQAYVLARWLLENEE